MARYHLEYKILGLGVQWGQADTLEAAKEAAKHYSSRNEGTFFVIWQSRTECRFVNGQELRP